MTVEIADEIWAAWRDAEFPEILLELVPTGDHRRAAREMREAIEEAQQAWDDAHDDEQDPPRSGEWDSVRGPTGVLVGVADSAGLEDVLTSVATALERRGVAGRFRLYEWQYAVAPPSRAHLLECFVRVRGTRVQPQPGRYRWRLDDDALEAVLELGYRWCTQAGGDVSYRVPGFGPIPAGANEDVLDRLLDASADRDSTELAAVRVDGYRWMATRPWTGAVSLVAGGDAVTREMLADLTGFLRDHADLFVYGYIRRGWALNRNELYDWRGVDWPIRADARPPGPYVAGRAFDDVFAPDAFGIQLLGPGYSGRIPDSPSWRREPLGDAVLLEHVDTAGWFDAPFVPFDEPLPVFGPHKPPQLVLDARAELAPILYTPGALHRAGYAEEPEL